MNDRVEWLRLAMAGTWSQLDERYRTYRQAVIDAVLGIDADTVVASHFIAINAVIGAATGRDELVIRSLDNCSVTVVEYDGTALRLIEGGHEADTLIR